MATIPLSQLSDTDLLLETARVAECERHTTAELLALLAELDARRLYLGAGYSSLFTYCTSALHLSESAAYSRITAARAARRFPTLLTLVAEGEVTLTTVSLLAAHLTDENHESLLAEARHKGRRDVERIVAGLCAQPDVKTTLRKLPAVAVCVETNPSAGEDTPLMELTKRSLAPAGATTQPPIAPRARALVAPLGNDRYLLRVTLSAAGRQHLDRARDLLRHTIPDGDTAAVIERALTVLVAELERRKTAVTRRPRKAGTETKTRVTGSRHIPASVKRAVWARDRGQCAFVGSHGRCGETGFLEFHHIEPFAAGGRTEIGNLQLRCRAHNQYEATMYFGAQSA